MKKFTLLVLAVAISLNYAIAADPAFEKLFSTKCLRCKKGVGTHANWDNPKVKIEPVKEDSEFYFDSIDLKNDKARLIANQGSADVIIMTTPIGITFIEVTGMGNLSITTVFAAYAKNTEDFIFVESRHMNIIGPFPSQYHGTCKAWE